MQSNVFHDLGIPQLSRRQMAREISERIRCSRMWCQQYWRMLCNPGLHCKAKFQMYKFFVRPILTYGCELWTLDDRNSKKLLCFESSILLQIYKSKYPHRHPKRLRPNIRTVYKKYRSADVVDHVNNERLQWNELLKNEEQALSRNDRRGQRCISWWDEPRLKMAEDNNRTIDNEVSFNHMQGLNTSPRSSSPHCTVL